MLEKLAQSLDISDCLPRKLLTITSRLRSVGKRPLFHYGRIQVAQRCARLGYLRRPRGVRMSELHLAKLDRQPKHLAAVSPSDVGKVRDAINLGSRSVEDEIEPALGVQLCGGGFRFRPSASKLDIDRLRDLSRRESRADLLSRGHLWVPALEEIPCVRSVPPQVVELLASLTVHKLRTYPIVFLEAERLV